MTKFCQSENKIIFLLSKARMIAGILYKGYANACTTIFCFSIGKKPSANQVFYFLQNLQIYTKYKKFIQNTYYLQNFFIFLKKIFVNKTKSFFQTTVSNKYLS